jgi:hypothetical protein
MYTDKILANLNHNILNNMQFSGNQFLLYVYVGVRLSGLHFDISIKAYMCEV